MQSRQIAFSGAVKNITRNNSNLMLNWCRNVTHGYKGIDIKDFGESWRDGLAFSALIHRFYPEAFDYSKLSAANPSENLQLAFEKAKLLAHVTPVIDIDYLLKAKSLDPKVIYTQLTLYYRELHRKPIQRNSYSSVGTARESPVDDLESEEQE
ncbi:unnamed protein product [Echinostoma caproni]|uniref:Calponin-homology (CH) domain-containing protein n=1 Tax=Echinostoma caproni TaxID=27848 RepID=A0A183ABI2_9TREM|nr:unnamed protein product [Echinostoma caproni]